MNTNRNVVAPSKCYLLRFRQYDLSRREKYRLGSIHSPDEIIEDLQIAHVGVAETVNTVFRDIVKNCV